MSASTTLQHVIILILRCSLFIFCRKFLLGSLYQDLRSLSYADTSFTGTGDVDAAHDSDNEIELPTTSARTTLPRVNTAPQSAMAFATDLFLPKLHEGKATMQSSLAQTSFSLCFEEGCILFLLVMCQAIGIFDANVRDTHWHISLFIIVFLVIILIPLLQCFLFTYREDTWHTLKPGMRLSLTLVPFLLYLFAFSYVPLPAHMEGAGFFTHALARMTVLGTLLLGLLSGFGAVSTAWSFQPFAGTSKVVTDKDINSAVAALDRVRSDLSQRLNDARLNEAPEPSSSWLPTGFFKGPSGSSALRQEIDGLRALESQMSRNVDALRTRRDELDFRKTLKGRFWTTIGKAFAIYCVVRIISSIRNVLFGPSAEGGTSSPDIITYLLARFVALFPSIPFSSEQVASLSRQISLLLVGCIILSSVRTILWQVGRLVRSSSRTMGAAFLLLFLAQLMGTYLLSTLIQIRTSFPSVPESSLPSEDDTVSSSSSTPPHNLFTSLPEYQLFGRLFDASFLAAAAITAAGIWAHRQLNRAEIFS